MYRPMRGLLSAVTGLVARFKPKPIVPKPTPLEAPGIKKRRAKKNARTLSRRRANRRETIAKESRRINARLAKGMGL